MTTDRRSRTSGPAGPVADPPTLGPGFREWPLVATLAAIAAALGYVGFERLLAAAGDPASSFDLIYLTLQLFVLESGSVDGPVPWQLGLARFLAPAVAAYTAIKGLTFLFRDHLTGLRARRQRNHVVICGLGRKGLALAHGLLGRGERVVAIERNTESDRLAALRAEGGLPVLGDGRSRRCLDRAAATRARYLVAISEDDGMNAEIVTRAQELASERGGGGPRYVCHVVEPHLWSLLRATEFEHRPDTDDLDYFNVFDSGAGELLRLHPAWDPGALDAGAAPHLVVVGMGRFGERVVVAAAQHWGLDRPPGARLRVTIIDRSAEAKREAFALRYPHLAEVCELHGAALELDSAAFYRGDFLGDREARAAISAVYVCTDDDRAGLAAALVLDRHLAGCRAFVAVRLTQERGLAELLRAGDGEEELDRIRPFGLLERACTPELVLGGTRELLARAIHEDYVRQSRARGDTPETNPSMVPWNDLPEQLRESSRDQAAHIGAKLRAIGRSVAPLTDWKALELELPEDQVERLAVMEHDRWVEERRRRGWRTGREKDVDRKISPHLVPWDELPEDVKAYDREFVQRIPFFLARTGLQIMRSSSRG